MVLLRGLLEADTASSAARAPTLPPNSPPDARRHTARLVISSARAAAAMGQLRPLVSVRHEFLRPPFPTHALRLSARRARLARQPAHTGLPVGNVARTDGRERPGAQLFRQAGRDKGLLLLLTALERQQDAPPALAREISTWADDHFFHPRRPDRLTGYRHFASSRPHRVPHAALDGLTAHGLQPGDWHGGD